MRDWEKAAWATGKSEAAVIMRVGELLANRIRQWVPAGSRVLVLAGVGHNGDDARHAEDRLKDMRVRICNVTDPEKNLAEVAEQLEQGPALIVDGLFGIGLNRPLDDQWKALIERVNASHIFSK